MDMPPTIAAEAALLRGQVAMSMVKMANDAEKQVANILEQAILGVSSSGRGASVDIRA